MENTLRNLLSIYIVLWTFSNSLVLFALNNRDKKVCGLSYGNLFRKQSNDITELKVALIGWIVWAIFAVIFNNICVMTIVMLTQLFLLGTMLVIINQRIELSMFKKELIQQAEKDFKCALHDKNIQTNWNQMLISDILKCFEFSKEEEPIVIELLQKYIETVTNELNNSVLSDEENENLQVCIYMYMLDTLLVKDERFPERWLLIYNNIIATGKNQIFQLALVIFLVRNNRVYPREYLMQFLENRQFEERLLEWTLAENYRIYSMDANDWRKSYYARLRSLEMRKKGISKMKRERSREVTLICCLKETMRRLKNIAEITVTEE